MEFPEDLRYTNEHEWARLEGTRVRVGITDFAQDALGDVVYVDLPEVGALVEAAERNPLIEDRPELVNEQPYGDGWLIVVELATGASVDGLMDAAAYASFVERSEQ